MIQKNITLRKYAFGSKLRNVVNTGENRKNNTIQCRFEAIKKCRFKKVNFEKTLNKNIS